MHLKITPILLASAALFLTTSCDQKIKSDATPPETPAKSDEPFIISPRLINNDGAYELLAVIEGAEANRQFVKNLQLIKAQGVAVKQLKDQADKTDEVKKKTEELEKKLQENTAMMVKIYAFNASADHMFLPVRSTLVKVTGDKKEVIKNMDSPAEHHNLQAMRGKYAELTKKDGENSAEAQTLAKNLMLDFNCDVKSAHEIEIHKGALYRKVN